MADPVIAVRNFDSAEVRAFRHGQFELCELSGHVIGRARYQPGWRWSRDLGPLAGTSLCQDSHVGVVIAGRAAVRMADGLEFMLRAGDAFVIPGGHDSWVVGEEPYESIHFAGADGYGRARLCGGQVAPVEGGESGECGDHSEPDQPGDDGPVEAGGGDRAEVGEDRGVQEPVVAGNARPDDLDQE